MQLDLYFKLIVPGGKNKSHLFLDLFPDIFLELQLRSRGHEQGRGIGVCGDSWSYVIIHPPVISWFGHHSVGTRQILYTDYCYLIA